MLAKRITTLAGALATFAAAPALAQELQVDFIVLAPVPIAGWAAAAIAGALAIAAHRTLRGRARTLSVMAAIAAAAAALGWNVLAPGATQAIPLPTVVSLTASPATVALENFEQNYQIVNASSRPIRIVSIERVNASGWTFVVSLSPECNKQQELRPGQYCYVALAPVM